MKEENQQLTKKMEDLIQSIQLLAADYKTQVNSLPEFVHVPDELAIVYADCFSVVIGLPDLTKQQRTKLKELNKILNKMSRNHGLWTLDALRESKEWKNIRKLATCLLKMFNRKKEKPRIELGVYVRG